LLAFVKSYVFKRGFLDGFNGFCIAAVSSYYTFVKYARLYELNNRKNA
jgi:hypothetical protein